jgi:hypothetical protein
MLLKSLVRLGLALGLGACASIPPNASTSSGIVARRAPPAGCVADTATRIPMRPGECVAFGRTYSQDDIKITGRTDVGQALSTLDPAVTTNSR